MVSAASPALMAAFAAVNSAFDRLESSLAYVAAQRHNTAEAQEAVQAELTAGWQVHSAKLEAELAESLAETDFLKDDNSRLSNQLQQLQQEMLALKTSANSTVKKLDQSVSQLDLILERA